MPRIKRWFPVSHDINHSPIIRELCRDHGAAGLRVWLEILSIADRAGPLIDCTSDGAIRRLASAAETRFKVVSIVVHKLLRVDSLRLHDAINHVTEVVNYWEYHRSEERKPVPTDPTRPDRTIKEKNIRVASQNFPAEWKWLETLVRSQNGGFPTERFLDFGWWDAVSYTCGGLSEQFLQREFAAMKRWIMDNPGRVPTPKGYRRFVAAWLERAHEHERRFKDAGKR